MKKITFLITGLGVGGAEQFLLKLIPRLNFNIEVISLTRDNEIGKQLEEHTKVTYFNFKHTNFLFQYFKLRKYIRRNKPDTLLTFLIHADIIGRFLKKDFKLISCVRNDYSKVTKLWYLDWFTASIPDLFIANSKALKPYLEKLKVPKEKRKYIPNGVDVDKFVNAKNVRGALGYSNEDKLIITVARLVPQKNHETLFKSMKMLPKRYKLCVVGDGPLKNDLQMMTADLGVQDRVFFLGHRGDVQDLLKTSDVFVLPSFTEGMSNALLEAMSAGLPCVASNIEQNKILIDDKRTGLLFDTMDSRQLAQKIQQVKKEYGKNARNLIKQKYTMEKISERYEKQI